MSLSSDYVFDLVLLAAGVVEFEARLFARMPKLRKSEASCHYSEQDRVNSLWLSRSQMLPAASPRFYAVRRGLVSGVYHRWSKYKNYILKFPSARYKSFDTIVEVYAF